MNKLQIILIAIVWILFINTTYCSNNISNITDIKYDWYLKDDTIIEIIWTDFKNCNNYVINSKELIINTIEETKITYLFWKNNSIKWNINFYCNNEIVSSNYSFPYISNFKLNNIVTDRKITISWNWFTSNSSVIFESWEHLNIENSFVTSINWIIPEKINWDTIYVSSNWLKSNIFDLNINIPKIVYLYTDKWFSPWNLLNIHWKNLNSYDNTYIEFWWEKLRNFKFDEKENNISFTIPNLSWINEISIYSNWIKSNSIDVDILNSNPHVENAYLRWFNVEENLESTYIEKLIVKWTNFTTNLENIRLYNNWQEFSVTSSNNKEIIINDFQFENWDNFLYLVINWTHSNVYYYYKDYKVPYISFVRPDSIVDNFRNVYVWVWNFDLKKDTLYFNDSPISVKSCIQAKCRVQIDSSILQWYFSIWLSNNYKTLPKYFNISTEKIPVIDNIYFYWDLKTWTKFVINGSNFYDADINLTNLVSKNTNNRLNIITSPITIEWALNNWYSKDEFSDITITKYWHIASLKFKWSDLNWKSVNGVWIIDKISTTDGQYLYKPWSKVQINWKWFHNTDNIIIWTNKTVFNYTNNVQWTFIIPSSTEAGVYNVKIENNNWLLSKWYNVLINDKYALTELNIVSNTDVIDSFKTNTIYDSDKIYSLNITNKVNDFIIKDLDFLFNNPESEYNLWTFKLYLNSKFISESIVNDKWVLSFNDIILDKNNTAYNLYLKKSSPFINEWEYTINLDKITTNLKGTNNKFTKINKNWVTSRKVYIYNRDIVYCYDSLEDNSNCNLHWSALKKEEETSDENIVKVSIQEDKSKVLYDKIDDIIEDIVVKNSNQSLFDQLNFYKDFRFKINKLLYRHKDHKLKIYLEYFYDEVDAKYKKVFKEYILSRK